ncbi:MAG: HAMP domain-containing histidine kinase [Leptospiraceae bacterium]|nr:HAMP domain-containing histidine kinase [Leptospiraceae bacterium]
MKPSRRNLSRLSLFSGSILAMAFSLLSVVVLLVWWQRLLIRNLELQYGFFRNETTGHSEVSPGLRKYIAEQDEKLAAQIFLPTATQRLHPDAARLIDERLKNRKKMVTYEQIFFIILLLSGHFFFLYIYFRERTRRRLTEETILLATHELRQPLQSLSLALETVAPTAKGRSRTAIETGMHEIAKLGQQIRWLAATFSGTMANHESTAIDNLNDYLQKLAEREFSPAECARLKISAANSALAIRMAEPLFHFLVRNLTENALKYSAAPSIVDVSAVHEGKKLRVAVTSHGQIIEKKEFGRVGRIFFRSVRADVQNRPGFGLGLYLASRIVRRSRGRLLLEHDGKGTTTAQLILRTT